MVQTLGDRIEIIRNCGQNCLFAVYLGYRSASNHDKINLLNAYGAQPLRPDFRQLLRQGPFAGRRQRPPRASGAAAARRRRQFTALWADILAAIGDRLRRSDREWMQRRRKVNTLLVALFVFRLVLAPPLQGYGPTLTELWGQCRQQGLFPPDDAPVSASSMCVARGKVGRRPFLRIHRALLSRVPADEPRWLWRRHRVFAVDGSKIHLPRRLRHDGYRCPSDSSHYPQGLLSTLFQLRARLPCDLDLSCHENERRAARAQENSKVRVDRKGSRLG